MSKTKWLSIIIGLVVVIGGSSYYVYKLYNPTVVKVSSTQVVDVNDDHQLAGYANNIFVGEVVAVSGNKKLSDTPETQFKVQVLSNIKGELKDTVTINQQGGKEGTKLYSVDDDKLLQPGKKYLFVTRIQENEGWHTVIPDHGDIEIRNDEELKKLTNRFTYAYKTEIPYQEGGSKPLMSQSN